MDKMNDSIQALDQKSDKIYQFLEQMDKKTKENWEMNNRIKEH